MAPSAVSPPILVVQDLHKAYGRGSNISLALKGISFTLTSGEIVGLLGPNGAGKTTTIKILLGLVRPAAGSFLFNVKKLGFMLDSPSMYDELSLLENLRIYCDLADTPFEKAHEKIALVGLEAAAPRKVKEFSLGMKKRAELARALVNDPELLLLDEPSSGLDPTAQQELRNTLTDLRAKGVTMMVTSHDLYNLERVCTRYLFIKEGLILRDVIAGGSQNGSLESLYHATMGGN